MAAMLTVELKAILTSVGTCSAFNAWLIEPSQNVLSVEDFAVLASKEALVVTNIIDKAKVKVTDAATIGESIRITKAWRACRAAIDASDKAAKEPAETRLEAPLDEPTKNSLAETWVKRHNIVLADSRLLIDDLEGAIYRQINAKPPRLCVYFLEQLRCRASLERRTHVGMVVQPGLHVRSEGIITDSVNDALEVYIRGRAMISTVAYCAVHNPSWFSLQDAEYFSDKLLTFVMQEVKGARPSLTYLVKAWAATMQKFSEAIRVNGMDLSVAVRKSDWEMLWTMWSAPATENSGPPAQPQLGDSNTLARECERLRKLASTLQSQNDRLHGHGGGKANGGGKQSGKNDKGGGDKRKFEDVRGDRGADRRGDDRGDDRRGKGGNYNGQKGGGNRRKN